MVAITSHTHQSKNIAQRRLNYKLIYILTIIYLHKIPSILKMCLQGLGVIYYTLKAKKNKDDEGNEAGQSTTPLGPVKYTVPDSMSAAPAKLADSIETQQYGGETMRVPKA